MNLAAQAGVRYSIANPDVYIEANLIGFYNILEVCRHSYDDGPAGRPDMAYFGFKPSTSLRDGLKKFAEWYKEFYLD